MEEERVYTIPLRAVLNDSRRKRSTSAVRLVKDFLRQHMDATEVKINSSLNEKIWGRGIEKPPIRVRVRAEKRADGVVEAYSLE